MHPDGMAVVLETPLSRSIVHSFEQARIVETSASYEARSAPRSHPTTVILRDNLAPITSGKEARHRDRNAWGIEPNFTVIYDGHRNQPSRLSPIVDDVSSSEVDDDVVAETWNAEIVRKLGSLIDASC